MCFLKAEFRIYFFKKTIYKFITIGYNTSCLRNGGCGEVVNTAGCGPVMRGFDPHRPPHNKMI